MRLVLGVLISIFFTACSGGSGGSTPTNATTLAPTISTFASDAETITLGDSATLTTAFSNGSASIDNDVGSVLADSVVVTPDSVVVTPASTLFLNKLSDLLLT